MRSDREEKLRRLTPTNEDLAYKTGRYPRALFRSELNTPGPLRDSVDRRKEAARDGHGPWLNFSREVYGRLLGIDTKPLDDAPEHWKRIHETMEKLPEWEMAKRQVEQDTFLTGVAAASLLDGISEAIPPLYDIDGAKREIEALEAAGQDTSSMQKRLEKMEQRMEDIGKVDASLIRSAARRGLQQAAEQVEEVKEGLVGLGADQSPPGSPQRVLATRMLSNPATRRLAKIAGRMRAATRRRHGEGPTVGREELVAVELGGDIDRLLPSELAMIADPDLEMLLYSKLLERRALQYELSGTDAAESGPILFLVDESGSMMGPRIEYAKAIMLGMMQLAISEGRSFAVVRFSRGEPDVHVFPHPGNPDMAELQAAVEGFRNGGTNIPEAMAYAFDLLRSAQWPDGVVWEDATKADVVLLTDGNSYELPSSAAEMETHGAQLYTIGIATTIPPWLVEMSAASVSLSGHDIAMGDTSSVEGMFPSA